MIGGWVLQWFLTREVGAGGWNASMLLLYVDKNQ